jgi:3-(3-hydroxy-phenyl)propionate hydroxylase
MTPAAGIERMFRDQVLHLAGKADFARGWVNSGRLSRPCRYPVTAPDDSRLPDAARPGSVAPDAPLEGNWLLQSLGRDVVLVALGRPAPDLDNCRVLTPEITQTLRARYLGDTDGAYYLVRPDQVIAARWVDATADEIARVAAGIWQGDDTCH